MSVPTHGELSQHFSHCQRHAIGEGRRQLLLPQNFHVFASVAQRDVENSCQGVKFSGKEWERIAPVVPVSSVANVKAAQATTIKPAHSPLTNAPWCCNH